MRRVRAARFRGRTASPPPRQASRPPTARPACDPALPHRIRRRLRMYRAAAYDPADPAAAPRPVCPPWASRITGSRLHRYAWYAGSSAAALAVAAPVAAGGWWRLAFLPAVAVLAAAELAARGRTPDIPAVWIAYRARGRFVDHAQLDARCRPLLRRAQAAIDTITNSAAARQVDAPAGVLASHEWEIACALRELTAAAAGTRCSPDALRRAREPLARRVTGLEAYAREVTGAEEALRKRARALRAGTTEDADLDLLAGAERHRLAAAEVTRFMLQAREYTQALTEEPG